MGAHAGTRSSSTCLFRLSTGIWGGGGREQTGVFCAAFRPVCVCSSPFPACLSRAVIANRVPCVHELYLAPRVCFGASREGSCVKSAPPPPLSAMRQPRVESRLKHKIRRTEEQIQRTKRGTCVEIDMGAGFGLFLTPGRHLCLDRVWAGRRSPVGTDEYSIFV